MKKSNGQNIKQGQRIWMRILLYTSTSIGIFLILYGLFAGYIPELQWKLLPQASENTALLQGIPQTASSTQGGETVLYPTSTYQLIIKKIGVDMPIVTNEADGTSALNRGAWQIPGSGTYFDANDPNAHKNLVLAGHRFLYTSGPNTFFHLDKVAVGDEIQVIWGGKLLNFTVFDTEIVMPDAVGILEDTSEGELTLFTCHPLYSTRERLVVHAKVL